MCGAARDNRVHYLLECVPFIEERKELAKQIVVQVLQKCKDNGEVPRGDALRAVLTEAHDLFTLFYGSIRALLLSHPDGGVARSCFRAFFPDFLSDFVVGRKFHLPSIGDSLTEKGFIQFFFPRQQTLLEALSLKGLLKSLFGERTIHHVLILFQNMMLTSSLSQADTVTLFRYATLRMVPSVLPRAPSRTGSFLRDHLAAVAPYNPFSSNDSSNPLGRLRLRNLFNNLSTTYQAGEILDPLIVVPDVGVFEGGRSSHFPRPLSQEGWWQGEDGFLDTDGWSKGTGGTTELPTVYLHQSEERLHLFAYQYKTLTILMLVPTQSGPQDIAIVKQHMPSQAIEKIHRLEEKLLKEWPGINAWHVPGYRYLYCDWDNKISKYSPPGKVMTVSKESLATLNRIRGEIDLETGRIVRSTSTRDREYELCVRTKQNAWVIVRCRGGKELYTVLERANNTLSLACDTVEHLNKQYFDGFFYAH